MPKLKALFERLPRYRNGFVFHGPHGGRLKNDTVCRVLVREVIKPLESRFPTADDEIGFRDGRVHSFRHYFCSSCADAGLPREMLMKMLSHKDSAMVSHYYHAREDVAHRFLDEIEVVSIQAGDHFETTLKQTS